MTTHPSHPAGTRDWLPVATVALSGVLVASLNGLGDHWPAAKLVATVLLVAGIAMFAAAGLSPRGRPARFLAIASAQAFVLMAIVPVVVGAWHGW